MFLLLPFITLITFFKSIYSIKDEYISSCHYNLKTFQNYTLRATSVSNETYCDCLPSDLINITNNTYNEIIICVLKCWKNNSTNFIHFANNFRGIINIFDNLVLGKMGKLILNITKKIVNNDSMIIQLSNILNSTNFSDLMIELVNNSRTWKNISQDIAYDFLARLLSINGFNDLFHRLYKNARDDILVFAQEFFLRYYPEIGNVFVEVRKRFPDILDDILIFIFDIIKHHKNKNRVFDLISDFLVEHYDRYDDIKDLMLDDKMNILYDLLIYIDDPFLKYAKKLILGNKKTLETFLDIMRNETSLKLGAEILKNIDNFNFLKEVMPTFLSQIVELNSSYVDTLTEFFFDLMFNVTDKKNDLSILTFSALQMFIENIFKELDYDNYNITDDCLELFKYTYFNTSLNDKSLFFLYFQKYIFDSSRNKGNFLPFDNCMDISYNINIETNYNYNISPAFIIGIYDEVKQKDENKNSSFYFKYNYLKGYCFPFGYKNKTQLNNKIPMCSDEDYERISEVIYHFYSNMSDIKIKAFSINKSNKTPSALHNFYGVLGFLALGFPILIYIFLLISRKIISNKQATINEIDDQNKNLKIKKNDLVEANIKTKKKKIIFPKWYKYLNEFFNIINNGKELFNFSFNNTNYNNIKGMTYIKGIIGIFSILTVIGQTFIALLNLPTKNYGIWDYYLMMSSPFYFILYIGYRYCPRILFSCSGYSLIYKYLCYIEQEQELYFLKFMFLQSYKYILLIFIIIIIKYPFYYIVFLTRQDKRPTWEIFKYFMDTEDNFIRRFFTFLIYLVEKVSSMKQNLIFYFYIPINEVLFFIFGTGLISLGYKFKLRIDIIIFVLVLLIYALKILLYFLYQNKGSKIYTTIDYYLFDYGLNLIHPLFNLSFFLIGMFFGLINYSIQKGITDLRNKDTNYENIFFLSETKDVDDGEEKNQEIKKMLTFSSEETNSNNGDLNIDNVSKTDESLIKLSKSNNKLYKNFIDSEKKNKKTRTNDINDINKNDNENLEKLISGQNEKTQKKKEYSEKIKQMPFLIWPIKFSNFHKRNKNKWIINIIIILAFLLLLFFISAQYIYTNRLIDEDSEQKLQELSFRKIIPKPALNIIFLLDIEIAIFIIQWINFILYFKEFGIIRNFFNHIYWSFFVKSYFTFNLSSATIILLFFYISETSIKFNFTNIILYAFIDLTMILICTIVVYSCFELSFKKIFKFFLKGKEAFNNEEDDDEYEEEENNENEEEKHLKD